MDKEKAKELIDKYLDGTCTPEERELVDRLYNRVLDKRIERGTEPDFAAMRAELDRRLPRAERKPMLHRIMPYAAAAAVLLLVTTGILIYLNQRPATEVGQTLADDVAPGGNRATLTLAGGRIIDLNDTQEGIVVADRITYTDGSELAPGDSALTGFMSQATEAAGELVLATPRGGTYAITLPDGTRVWLNAASSLTYPARFDGKERAVQLTGEGYFEVARDTRRPFRVAVAGQEVTVLGTHFNINAYGDEPAVTTTLLEGSVRVAPGSGKGTSVMLVPGQRSRYADGDLTVTEGDTEAAVAWRNGYFRFRDEGVERVMRQLSRWYDVEVVYQGQIPDEGYFGTISRYKNISQALDMLAKTKTVQFRVEGRRVIVMP